MQMDRVLVLGFFDQLAINMYVSIFRVLIHVMLVVVWITETIITGLIRLVNLIIFLVYLLLLLSLSKSLKFLFFI
jgi:hypothetical protein